MRPRARLRVYLRAGWLVVPRGPLGKSGRSSMQQIYRYFLRVRPPAQAMAAVGFWFPSAAPALVFSLLLPMRACAPCYNNSSRKYFPWERIC